MKDKWKEKTKLNKIKIKEIIVQVLLVIICIVIAIINKDYTYFLVAGLDVIIAIQIYCNAKLLKAKQAIIGIIDEQDIKSILTKEQFNQNCYEVEES